MTEPFPLIELAVKDLIETVYTPSADKVGGDLSYTGATDFYVWIGLVPGGATNQLEGSWSLDIDVFGKNYAEVMGHALALEAALIGSRHRTDTLLIDNCYQNQAPAERFWDDETVFRIGSTYTVTARRSG